MKKYVIMLVCSVLVMFTLLAAIDYYLAKQGAEKELLAKAERDLKESKRVDSVKVEVESAVRNLKGDVQQALNDPDRYYIIASKLVKNNKSIVGAGIAFPPNYYEGRNRLFAPYAYDEQPAIRIKKRKTHEPQIRTEILGFDYTDREWFVKPIETGKSLWTQPYVDKGGSHIIMTTYVEPIFDKNGKFAGAFFADVPMEDVSILAVNFTSDLQRGVWIIILTQIVFMGLFIVIVFLAVKASRRYKLQKVDAEKAELIAEIERLKETNKRLTKRNLELGDKLSSLTR